MGEAVARLARGGVSILVAEQKTDLLSTIADEVVVLAAGRVTLRGRPDDVFGDPRLRELGVPEPAAVRLARVAAEAGVASSTLTEALRG